MRDRLPSWILLVYRAIDFGNPFVSGAVRFTPEKGLMLVEGLPCAETWRDADERAPMGQASPRGMVVSDMPVRGSDRATPPASRLTDWLAEVRSGGPPARDVPHPATHDSSFPRVFR
jgi:hypothetical protein